MSGILANMPPFGHLRLLFVHVRFLFILRKTHTHTLHTTPAHTHLHAPTHAHHTHPHAASSTEFFPLIIKYPVLWLWFRCTVERDSGNLGSPFLCVTSQMTRHFGELERVIVTPAVHLGVFEFHHFYIEEHCAVVMW